MALVFHGSETGSAAHFGARRLTHVYAGSRLVWTAWLGSTATCAKDVSGESWTDVPALSPSDTHTFVTGTPPALVVQGSKNGARVSVTCESAGGIAASSRVRVLVNGVEANASMEFNGKTTHTWTGTLQHGDLVRFQYQGSGALFTKPVMRAGAAISIA